MMYYSQNEIYNIDAYFVGGGIFEYGKVLYNVNVLIREALVYKWVLVIDSGSNIVSVTKHRRLLGIIEELKSKWQINDKVIEGLLLNILHHNSSDFRLAPFRKKIGREIAEVGSKYNLFKLYNI